MFFKRLFHHVLEKFVRLDWKSRSALLLLLLTNISFYQKVISIETKRLARFKNDNVGIYDNLIVARRQTLRKSQWIIVFKKSRVFNVSQKVEKILSRSVRLRRRVTILHEYSNLLPAVLVRLKSTKLLRYFLEDDDVGWVEQDQIILIDPIEDNPQNNTFNGNRHLIGTSIQDAKDKVQDVENWGLDRIDQVSLPLDSKYRYKYEGSNVEIFIVDSGVQKDTEELDDRVSCELNLVQDEDCDDLKNHGTKVASVAAGYTYGVAKNAHIKSVKVINQDGESSTSTIFKALDAIGSKKAGKNKRRIVNLSIGTAYSRSLNDMVDQLVDSGIVVVVAAGNHAQDACEVSPASAFGSITVAASDKDDTVWTQSNYGNCVDIIAPGVMVLASSSSSKDASSLVTGTSFAAPYVSGVVALLFELYPDATPAEIRNVLLRMSSVSKLLEAENYPNLLVSTESIDVPMDLPTTSPTINIPVLNPVKKTQPPSSNFRTGCGIMLLTTCSVNNECCSNHCTTFPYIGRRCWL